MPFLSACAVAWSVKHIICTDAGNAAVVADMPDQDIIHGTCSVSCVVTNSERGGEWVREGDSEATARTGVSSPAVLTTLTRPLFTTNYVTVSLLGAWE